MSYLTNFDSLTATNVEIAGLNTQALTFGGDISDFRITDANPLDQNKVIAQSATLNLEYESFTPVPNYPAGTTVCLDNSQVEYQASPLFFTEGSPSSVTFRQNGTPLTGQINLTTPLQTISGGLTVSNSLITIPTQSDVLPISQYRSGFFAVTDTDRYLINWGYAADYVDPFGVTTTDNVTFENTTGRDLQLYVSWSILGWGICNREATSENAYTGPAACWLEQTITSDLFVAVTSPRQQTFNKYRSATDFYYCDTIAFNCGTYLDLAPGEKFRIAAMQKKIPGGSIDLPWNLGGPALIYGSSGGFSTARRFIGDYGTTNRLSIVRLN